MSSITQLRKQLNIDTAKAARSAALAAKDVTTMDEIAAQLFDLKAAGPAKKNKAGPTKKKNAENTNKKNHKNSKKNKQKNKKKKKGRD